MNDRTPACPCRDPAVAGDGDTLFLSSASPHVMAVCERVLREAGVPHARHGGLLRASVSQSPARLLAALTRPLSRPERDAARAFQGHADAPAHCRFDKAKRAPSQRTQATRSQRSPLLEMVRTGEGLYCDYQPIVRLSDNEVIGYEALLRGEVGGQRVAPGDLFQAARDAGWSQSLDLLAREAAIAGAADWLGDATLFINFLPSTVYRPEVCLRTTQRALERAGLRFDQVVFEVVETERVDDTDHLCAVLDYYRQRGGRVALDDLGAGYSSLNLLARVRPDVVKIDRELVAALSDRAGRAILRAVLDIAREIDCVVLAEGVETREQAEVVAEMGVDLGQGWYFGRPARPARPPREGAA